MEENDKDKITVQVARAEGQRPGATLATRPLWSTSRRNPTRGGRSRARRAERGKGTRKIDLTNTSSAFLWSTRQVARGSALFGALLHGRLCLAMHKQKRNCRPMRPKCTKLQDGLRSIQITLGGKANIFGWLDQWNNLTDHPDAKGERGEWTKNIIGTKAIRALWRIRTISSLFHKGRSIFETTR